MKKALSIFLAALLALHAVCIPAAAVDPDSCVISVYNDRNGLPTGEANAVVQTPDGYIWIGSYGGLIRYDGTEFRNYSDEGLLSSSTVRSLYVDSAGRLWIGSNDRGVFMMEGDRFVQPSGQPLDSILCIRGFAEDSGGNIYVSSSSGMAKITDGIMTVFGGDIDGMTFYSAAVDKYGRIWGCVNYGAVVLDSGGSLLAEIPSERIFDDAEIYSIGGTRDGTIWIGSDKNRAARVELTGEELSESSMKITIYDTGSVSTINSIAPAPDGGVMINALQGAGIISASGELTEYTEAQYASSVSGSYIDYEGNFWLASSANGVIKYSQGCFAHPGASSGLSGRRINTLTSSGGSFYLGTDKGLLIYDEDWKPHSSELTARLEGKRIRHIISGSDGRIWIASYSDTPVICFDPADGSIRSWGKADDIGDSSARVLAEMSDGSLAVGTQIGLDFILADGSVRSVTELSGAAVLCFYEISPDALLIGTDGHGIYKLTGSGIAHLGGGSPSGGVILDILPDSQPGCYFISTGSGLVYFDGSGYRSLPNLNKLPGNIFDMYLREDTLYILQNSGVTGISREDVLKDDGASGITHGFDCGLSGSLFANTRNWLSPDGSLYISTGNGLSVFDFSQPETTLPKCVVNKITVDGKVFEHPDSITVPSSAVRVSVDFAALTFSASSRLTIGCRLEGFDREESYITDSGSASVSYTNLPGGTYTLIMRVFLTDSPEQSEEYRVTIIKERALTEQPWFIALTIAAGLVATVCATLLCLRFRMRSMKRRQEQYRDMLEQTLKTFGGTIDAKDKYTNGHSLRVARYSKEIARRMGMSQDQQEHIYYVALLHDIGKIGVPDSILTKPGRLTDEERQVIQQHPAIGGRILRNFTAISDIADGAKYHHERYDGKGYNEGLKGEEIPLIARIIAVADTYDAMSSKRCYRNSLPSDAIIAELERVAGTQLDPAIVPVMVGMIKDGTAPIVIPEQVTGNE